MTLHVVDVSRHQVERADPLDLAKAKAAGFGAVNIQLDRGRQTDILPAWAPEYAAEARRLGLGISTYRWLDNRIPGGESARRAFARMAVLGGPVGMAHVVDCEENATEQHLRDYVTTMVELLGRPIAIYSGRWWLAPRGWIVSDLSPFLWSAPSAGYLGGYPGDDSRHWQVTAYGGYTGLAAMQYMVGPLPGTGPCSLSAIRDPAVWTTLTGETSMGAYEEWVRAGRPVSGTARPVARIGARLRGYGYTVYFIGNQEHLEHLPPEDHTPFAATGWPGASPRWWVMAMDIMPPPAGSGLPSLQQIGAQMLADRKAGVPGMMWLKYMNWEPERNNGGACYQERFMPSHERRSSSDRGHIHQSARSDCHAVTYADDYDPVARIRAGGKPEQQKEDDMTIQYLIKLEGDPTVRLVTLGVGHIPVTDEADLVRWKSFLSANTKSTQIFDWPAAWAPQLGPDLSAQPSLSVTPEVAAVIAKQIIDAGSNDLSDADLDEIKALVVAGSKQAAREGTSEA